MLKTKFDYDYTFGDFVTQYNLLKSFGKDEILLYESVKVGELALVIWSLKDKNKYAYDMLVVACAFGHLEVVKYLMKNGSDIHSGNNEALIVASEYGYVEIVKYLIKNGADIHAQREYALRTASEYGYLEVVKFLVENGADIHAENNYALRKASFKHYSDIVKYLKSKM
jgi:ankyrin repeat protein